MRSFFQFIFLTLIVTLVSLTPTNSYSKEVKCFVLEQPEQMFTNVKQIAVMDFEVQGRSNIIKNPGALIADYIVASLLEEDRGIREVGSGFLGLGSKEGKTYQKGVKTNFYTLAERSRITQVIEEQQFSESGMVDDVQAVNVGQILGVDAVLTGTIEVITSAKRYKEKRKSDNKEYFVQCLKHEAKIKASMRIVSVETGQILGQTNQEFALDDDDCEKTNEPEVESLEEMAGKCLKRVVVPLVNYFAPHFALQKIELQKVKAKPYKEKAKSALENIEDDNFQDAFVKYSWMVDQDPYLHEAIYMKGVLYELVGDYRNAIEQYEMALEIKDDEKDYRKALTRAKDQYELWQGLNVMGIYLEYQKFTFTEEDLAKVEQKKVKLKGDSGDRVEVYAEADKKSDVISSVPGGVKLDYIETDGKYYKVRLINKKEGYIEKKKAKDPE